MKKNQIKGINYGIDYNNHTQATGKLVRMKGLTGLADADPKRRNHARPKFKHKPFRPPTMKIGADES